MKKSLIIGIATLAITGSALLWTGIYAATTTTTDTTTQHSQRMERWNPEDMVQSLSGKVSTEALNALETLMTKHKAEMDAARNNTTTIDEATRKAQMEAFKTEMDALLVKYPELKTALPQGREMGKRGERGQGNPMNSVLSALPSDAQTEIKTIRESYKTKMDTLRTEEETATEAVIAKYPEVKAKYDAAKVNRPTGNDRQPPESADTNTSTASAISA